MTASEWPWPIVKLENVSVPFINLIRFVTLFYFEQDSIPVGCVPTAAVASTPGGGGGGG